MEHLKHERNPVHAFLGFAGIFVLAAYVNIFPPEQVQYVVSFFVLLFVTVTLLGIYLFRNFRQSILIAGGLVLYLALRYFGLRHPLYGILLLASIISIEYLWKHAI